jgi:hypothetical protein
MRLIRFGLFLFVTICPFLAWASGPAIPDVFEVMAEFDRETATELWPGFDPRSIPVALYDGKETWLFRHPHPPQEFTQSPQHAGVFVAQGRHSSVLANTGTELDGVATATAILEGKGDQPARELAALVIHECFHVYEKGHHPKWTANELDLVVYPLEDVELLQRRREESEGLRLALLAKTKGDLACWAGEALRFRELRFGGLPRAMVDYERGNELNEGLANYLQVRAAGRAASFSLPQSEFGIDKVRERGYETGAALALLLDRLSPGWQKEMESGQAGSLDSLLHSKLQFVTASCAFSDLQESAMLSRARTDVSELKTKRQRLKNDFARAEGWQIVVSASPQRPLSFQGFDPLNITVLSSTEVLHSRFLKLGGDDGSVRILDHGSLTEGAGSHPLFNGARKVTIAGITDKPVVKENGGSILVTAAGVRAEFRHALVRIDQKRIIVELGEGSSVSSH